MYIFVFGPITEIRLEQWLYAAERFIRKSSGVTIERGQSAPPMKIVEVDVKLQFNDNNHDRNNKSKLH